MDKIKNPFMIKKKPCPGRVALLVRALSQYAKVVGSIPGQGTHKNQPVNASVSGTTNRCFSLSLKYINK